MDAGQLRRQVQFRGRVRTLFKQCRHDGVDDFGPLDDLADAFDDDLLAGRQRPPVQAVGPRHPVQPAGIEDGPFAGGGGVGHRGIGFLADVDEQVAQVDHLVIDGNGVAEQRRGHLLALLRRVGGRRFLGGTGRGQRGDGHQGCGHYGGDEQISGGHVTLPF